MKNEKMNEFHFFDDMTTYLSKTDHDSASDLKNISETTQQYEYGKEDKDEEEKSFLSFGSLVHCMILEPSNVDKYFFHFKKDMLPFPDSTMNKKENKEEKAKLLLLAKVQKKKMITDAMMEAAEIATDSVKSNKKAVQLLENTYSESSFYVPMQIPIEDVDGKIRDMFGIKARIRPDAIAHDASYYISVKTSKDVSPSGFMREAWKYKYMLSEAFYSSVLESMFGDNLQNRYIFAVSNNKKKPMCVVYDLDYPSVEKYFLNAGNQMLNNAIMRLYYYRRVLGGVSGGYEQFDRDYHDGVFPLMTPFNSDFVLDKIDEETRDIRRDAFEKLGV